MIHRTYRFRIYPTCRQVVVLEEQLGFNCALYNAALEQRQTAWKQSRKRVNLYEQQKNLTELRSSGKFPVGMNAAAQRDPLRRIDKAFKAFFARVQKGQKPGYPRFKSRQRYNTLVFKHGNGAHIRDDYLTLQAIGSIKVKWHRQIPDSADIRTISVTRRNDRWHVSFAVKLLVPEQLEPTGEIVGLDMGVTTFVTLSTGERIKGPRAGKAALAKQRILQRRVSRRVHGSNRRRKTVRLFARQQEHVRNIRCDHAHKVSRDLANRFDLIAIEDLRIRNMISALPLAREIQDQAWGQFLEMLVYKAAEAGRQVIKVDPRDTSQECSRCGTIVKKRLDERTHQCPQCGLILDRDHNSAKTVLNRALGSSVQALTWKEVASCVA